ncbi:MAG: DUF2090 domain-containing protein [Patescibacteria group bacterium]
MKNLFFLPFDHRASFAEELLGTEYPVNHRDARRIRSLKRLIFRAFLKARKEYKRPEELALLVDEEFGKKILKTAKKKKILFAQTTEASGGELISLEYGDQTSEHLKKFNPTYAKVLVRYNPASHEKNILIHKRLLQLQMICKDLKIKFLIELLVKGNEPKHKLIAQSIRNLEKEKITPDLWKLEGLDSTKEWKEVARATDTPIIVLGRGASKKDVSKWIHAASQSGVVSGIAIGRTVFMPALKAYQKKQLTKKETIAQIAKEYLDCVNAWNQAKKEA